MGYRNETEALRAKVSELEEQVARLEGRRRPDGSDGKHRVRRQSVLVWLAAIGLTLGVAPCGLSAWMDMGTPLEPGTDAAWIEGHMGERVRFDALLDVAGRARRRPAAEPQVDYGSPVYDEYEYEYFVPLAGDPRVLISCTYGCPSGLRLDIQRATTSDQPTISRTIVGRPAHLSRYERDPRIEAYAQAHDLMIDDLVVVQATNDGSPPLFVMAGLLAVAALFAWLMVFLHRKLASGEVPLPTEQDQHTRQPTLVWVLALVSCHAYVLYWQWVTTAQLRRLTGRADLIPAVDLAMTFLTLGLWRFWVAWRNSEAIDEALSARGEVSGVAGQTLMWIVVMFGCSLAEYVMLHKLQEAINRLALEDFATHGGADAPRSF